MSKISPNYPSKEMVLHHKSNEYPYTEGVYIDICPQCKKYLPNYVIKQLELGYRVYCPTEGCFYPLFTIGTTQKKAPKPLEPPKIRDKVPDAPKVPQTQQAVPAISKLSSNPQEISPLKMSAPPKELELKYCPHCKHPLSETQIRLKQSGRKVMCRECLELI